MADNNQNTETTPADILDFLKEHMVMKEDFEEVKSDVSTLKENMATKMDVAALEARFSEFQLELEGIKRH